MAQPGGLPGSTRAEKKEALVWQGEKTTSKLHFAPHSGINASIINRPFGASQLKLLLFVYRDAMPMALDRADGIDHGLQAAGVTAEGFPYT
jgi:hypothetical protein